MHGGPAVRPESCAGSTGVARTRGRARRSALLGSQKIAFGGPRKVRKEGRKQERLRRWPRKARKSTKGGVPRAAAPSRQAPFPRAYGASFIQPTRPKEGGCFRVLSCFSWPIIQPPRRRLARSRCADQGEGGGGSWTLSRPLRRAAAVCRFSLFPAVICCSGNSGAGTAERVIPDFSTAWPAPLTVR